MQDCILQTSMFLLAYIHLSGWLPSTNPHLPLKLECIDRLTARWWEIETSNPSIRSHEAACMQYTEVPYLEPKQNWGGPKRLTYPDSWRQENPPFMAAVLSLLLTSKYLFCAYINAPLLSFQHLLFPSLDQEGFMSIINIHRLTILHPNVKWPICLIFFEHVEGLLPFNLIDCVGGKGSQLNVSYIWNWVKWLIIG